MYGKYARSPGTRTGSLNDPPPADTARARADAGLAAGAVPPAAVPPAAVPSRPGRLRHGDPGMRQVRLRRVAARGERERTPLKPQHPLIPDAVFSFEKKKNTTWSCAESPSTS